MTAWDNTCCIFQASELVIWGPLIYSHSLIILTTSEIVIMTKLQKAAFLLKKLTIPKGGGVSRWPACLKHFCSVVSLLLIKHS